MAKSRADVTSWPMSGIRGAPMPRQQLRAQGTKGFLVLRGTYCSLLAPRHEGDALEQVHVLLVLEERCGQQGSVCTKPYTQTYCGCHKALRVGAISERQPSRPYHFSAKVDCLFLGNISAWALIVID
jgi:hypothetical protein